MATVIKCDKCSKEIPNGDGVKLETNSLKNSTDSDVNIYQEEEKRRKVDLCDSCWIQATSRFFEWLR